jgi:hypothetical protein
MTYLKCPVCGDECESIPPCGESREHDCAADWHAVRGDWWCEDRDGTCACGAALTVVVEDGAAELVEVWQ